MKNLIHRTKLSIRLQVTNCLQIVQKCNKKQTWLLQGQECMERVCKELRDHAVKIINYEEKEMIPLTDRENKSDGEQKVCYICNKEFCTDKNDKNEFKLYHKARDHCHCTGKFRGAAHSICNSRYKTPKETTIIFHNVSTYDYHFKINQLAKEFKGKLEYYEKIQRNILLFSTN